MGIKIQNVKENKFSDNYNLFSDQAHSVSQGWEWGLKKKKKDKQHYNRTPASAEASLFFPKLLLYHSK